MNRFKKNGYIDYDESRLNMTKVRCIFGAIGEGKEQRESSLSDTSEMIWIPDSGGPELSGSKI
jgi:hypothetical protein